MDAGAPKRRRVGMYPGSQDQPVGVKQPPRAFRDVRKSGEDLLPDPDEAHGRRRGQVGSLSVAVNTVMWRFRYFFIVQIAMSVWFLYRVGKVLISGV